MKDEKEKYTFLQYKEICLGRMHGLSEQQIRLYARPSMNYRQMQIIREDLERGTEYEKVRYFAKPWLSADRMQEIREELENRDVAEMPMLIHTKTVVILGLLFLLALPASVLLYREIHPHDALVLQLKEEQIILQEGDRFVPSFYVKKTSGRGARLILPEEYTAEEEGTRLLVYRLARGKEETVRYLRVTVKANASPEIILNESEITVHPGEETDCFRYVERAEDPEEGDLLTKVTCEAVLKDEENYLYYRVADRQGRTAEAYLHVNTVQEDKEPVPTAVYTPFVPVYTEPQTPDTEGYTESIPDEQDLTMSLNIHTG